MIDRKKSEIKKETARHVKIVILGESRGGKNISRLCAGVL